MPGKHIALVSSLPVPSITSEITTAQIATHLGVQARTAALILVEDEVAAELLNALLAKADREALRQVDIRPVATGESGVKQIIKAVGSVFPNNLSLLGILDGDQRPSKGSRHSNGQNGTDQKLGYLVGKVAPELVIREALEKWHMDPNPNWTPSLPGGDSALRLCLERLDGKDLHDWIRQLAGEFGGLGVVCNTVVDLLFADESLVKDCESMIRWISSKSNFSA